MPNYLAIQLPPDASSTLYVEGLPSDATEREVSHIFRRFEGQVRAVAGGGDGSARWRGTISEEGRAMIWGGGEVGGVPGARDTCGLTCATSPAGAAGLPIDPHDRS